jgi:hypothetical protein
LVKRMIAVPDRIADSEPPLRIDRSSPRAVRKVVVIQVKRRLWSEASSMVDPLRYDDGENFDFGRSSGQVLGTKIVDMKDGRVVFWFLKRSAGKNLGFEFSFLQGAAAAVVLLELSDRETIHMTKELLRDICKVFPIPVMLVVGGAMQEDLAGPGSSTGLEEIASRIVSFVHEGRSTVPLAS